MLALNQNTALLFYLFISVGGLVILIAYFKLNAFVALIVASLFIGVASGMNLPEIGKVFAEGVGSVLGMIAIVVGLGTILGKLLAESGGAEVIAKRLIELIGVNRIDWAILLIALIVGIPVWFSVGLVLLIPIVYTLAKETHSSFLRLGIPLVAGLSAAHGLVPPHPGPMMAIEIFKADPGTTIFYSILVAAPIAIVGGPLFGAYIARRVRVDLGELADQLSGKGERTNLPGFGLTLLTILLPVGLMLLATLADLLLPADNAGRRGVDFVGSPIVAMLAGVLLAFYSFGWRRGFSKQQISRFAEECLGPVATVLLVVGAGGGFSKVLVASGAGEAMADLARVSRLEPLLLGWMVAALIRIATGSATVAIGTAAGIVAPMVARMPGINAELMVLSMGAGSLILSHVNDGGFWFVKEYFNMSVTQTLQTWTVMETILSVLALILILLVDFLV